MDMETVALPFHAEFYEHLPDGLLELVRDFVFRSGDHERTPFSILTQVDSILRRKNGGLWVFYQGDERIGFACAEIQFNERGTHTCLVHHFYLNPIHSDNHSFIQQAELEISNFGKRNGAAEMAFFTRRNPEAFRKILMPGWIVDSFVLRRDL